MLQLRHLMLQLTRLSLLTLVIVMIGALFISVSIADPLTPLPLPSSFDGSAAVSPDGDPVKEVETHLQAPSPFAVPMGGGAPSNDNFANAAVIPSLPYNQDVAGIEVATLEANELFGFCNGRSKSVWYKFTLAADTLVDISLNGSNYDTVLVLYENPSGDTISFETCNDDFNGFQSALYNQALKAGSYYLQVLGYSTGPSSTALLSLDIRPSAVELPEHFRLEYFGNSVTIPVAPTVFGWDEAAGATSYAFTLERTIGSDPLGEVFTLSGLTPADDSDGLLCQNDTCYLDLPAANQAQITSINTYIWYVVASNANGSTNSYASSITPAWQFIYNSTVVPTSFGQFYPVNGRTRPIAPSEMSWSASLGADTYTVTVNRTAPTNEPNILADLVGLTPQDDADGLECTLFSCILSLNLAQQALLTDNATYQWQVAAVNTNGNQPTTFSSFQLDSTPAPREFFVNYPTSNWVVVNTLSSNFSLQFQNAFGAVGYDLVVNRISDPAGVVFSLTDLTPEFDAADGLSCSVGTEDFNGFCTYALTAGQSAALVDGSYSWLVTAKNANGTRTTSTTPSSMTFIVNSTIVFDALTPADGASFADAAGVTNFTWQEPGGGATTSLYNFFLNGLYGGTRFLSSMTAAADNDRLTCESGVCTLAVSGVEFGLARNRYLMYVSALGSVNSQSFFIQATTDNLQDFTIGDIPASNELVSNSSFENPTRSVEPWVAKNLVGAKQKCNKDGKVFSYSGTCAWQAGGRGSTGKLEQLLPVTNLIAEDTLIVSTYAEAKNNGTGAQIRLRVTYADTNLPKGKINLTMNAGTYGYTYFAQPLMLAGVPSKIKIMVRNTSTTGRVRFDLVSVRLDLAGRRGVGADNGLIALPAAESSGLGGRDANRPSGLGGVGQ